MKDFKCLIPDVVAVMLFFIIAFTYFFPADVEGRIIAQQDAVAGIGAGQEAKEYYERTGEKTWWTNSLFGGMPTFQTSPSYPSSSTLNIVERIYHLYLPNYIWMVFAMLLGFYILMRVLGFNMGLSLLGAIVWAFSSYFFIIIAAGHHWKFFTLAYIPPTIAGMVLAYRGRLLWGGLLTALFVALQIKSNHVQMSYYFLFVMLFMAIAYAVMAFRNHKVKKFLVATAVLIVAGLLGVGINASNLYHTYQYSQESMRGKSELKQDASSDHTSNGLDRSYITAWSYGIGETMTLMVPNAKGGASDIALANNEQAISKANPMYMSIYQQLGQYWGDQPGTSGPVYVGAFVVFLFILGLFIVKGPMKWALAIATLLSILLSWGHNFMWFTNLFIDHMPMYSKFRTVASILVIAEFTMPLLGLMALKKVLEKPALLKSRDCIIALALTAGLSLIFALFPDMLSSSYIPANEMKALKTLPQEHVMPIITNLSEMRRAILTADAWRSFFIIALGIGLLWLYAGKKLNAKLTVAGLAVLCLVDMWMVNKRYLNDSMFTEPTNREMTYVADEADKLILADKDLDYRVLNLAASTFNENNTSYWHKSIGGYHAAKLRRYQETIEEHIVPEMQSMAKGISQTQGDMAACDPTTFRVLNMLNTRYVIVGSEQERAPIRNPHAYGNAWFVGAVTHVNNADEELQALHHIMPNQEAVVDAKFASCLPKGNYDTNGSIKLTAYEPNKLTYEVASDKGGVIVFSEIYYPGWKSFVDGVEMPHGRADYILRAMQIEGGKHEVTFSFNPQSLHITEATAYGALIVLAIAFVIAIAIGLRTKRGKPTC